MAEQQSTLELVVELVDNASQKMEGIKNKTQEANESVSEGMDDSSDAADNMNDSLQENADAADEAENSFMRLTGQGLALLFAGRFLKQTFGGLVRSMAGVVGISDQLTATMKSVLSPAFVQLQEMMQPLFEFLMNMSDRQKRITGWAVILVTVMAAVLSVVGQVVAGFSVFAGAVGIAAGTALGLVAGFGAILAVGFYIGTKLPGFINRAVDRTVKGFKNLIDFFLNVATGQWGKAFDNLLAIADAVISGIIDFFTFALPDDIRESIMELKDNAGRWFSDVMSNALSTVKSWKDDFTDFFMNLIPDWAQGAVGGAMDMTGSAAGAMGDLMSFGANDFVMSGNRLIKTHPNDVIFGTKQPEKLGMGGGASNVTINVDRPQLNNEMDIDRMVDKIERRIDRDTRGRSSIS